MNDRLRALGGLYVRGARPSVHAMHGGLLAKETPMKQCINCGRELKGRQEKFCSTVHKDEYWTRARKLGMEVPGFTDPDPVINAFLQDFRQLLESHKEAVDALAAKRKF